jgi:hypothetical protein
MSDDTAKAREHAAFLRGSDRRCPCGEPLDGRRRDAVVCSAACRRALSRIRGVQQGRAAGPVRSLADIAARRRQRADRAQRAKRAKRVKASRMSDSTKWGRVALTTGPVSHKERYLP